MPFKKNDNRINKNGRPQGAKNKLPFDLRARITDYLNDNFQSTIDEINTLPAHLKIKYYMELLNYGLPKLQSTSNESINKEIINITPIRFVEVEYKEPDSQKNTNNENG